MGRQFLPLFVVALLAVTAFSTSDSYGEIPIGVEGSVTSLPIAMDCIVLSRCLHCDAQNIRKEEVSGAFSV